MNRQFPSPSKRAAAAMLRATNPRHVPLTALRQYEKFAAEVLDESGADVLAVVVEQVAQHAALTRGRAA